MEFILSIFHDGGNPDMLTLLKTVQIQICWLLKKAADQDPYYFLYNIWVHNNENRLLAYQFIQYVKDSANLFVWFDSLRPINNLSIIKGRVFLGWTSTKLGLMFLLKDTTQWRLWGLNPLPFGQFVECERNYCLSMSKQLCKHRVISNSTTNFSYKHTDTSPTFSYHTESLEITKISSAGPCNHLCLMKKCSFK